MPEMTPKKIRQMSPAEREKKIEELRTALAKARASNVASGAQDTKGQIKKYRRTLARIYTIIREEELGRLAGAK
ncbi:MAG: 50S ribosomal protein L29, partial [Candidatus Ranarchaeia archaeon]